MSWGAGRGPGWGRLRTQVLERDNHLCCLRFDAVCVDDATQVDHRTPKHLGGTDDLDNLQSVCGPCHRLKTADEASRARVAKRDGLKRAPKRHPGEMP